MSSLDLTPLSPPEPEGAGSAGPAQAAPSPDDQGRMPSRGAETSAAGGAVDPETEARLRANAAGFVQQVLALPPHSPEVDRRVQDVTTMGDAEVAASAQLSRRMLDRQARSGSVGRRQGGPEQAASEQLLRLRSEVEALDPADLDKPARKLLGFVPMGDRVRDYFERYYASQDRINLLIVSLRTQQDALRKDNAAIAGERANLRRLVEQLEGYAVLAGAIDAELEARLPALAASEPEWAGVLRDQLQRAARHKHQDLLTHLAVCQQGRLALDIVQGNNEALVTGIERAATTTLAALRTAVIVSDALQGQRLVLDRIEGADRASAAALDGAAAQMRTGVASGSPEAVSRLKEAFGDVYAALDTAAGATAGTPAPRIG